SSRRASRASDRGYAMSPAGSQRLLIAGFSLLCVFALALSLGPRGAPARNAMVSLTAVQGAALNPQGAGSPVARDSRTWAGARAARRARVVVVAPLLSAYAAAADRVDRVVAAADVARRESLATPLAAIYPALGAIPSAGNIVPKDPELIMKWHPDAVFVWE